MTRWAISGLVCATFVVLSACSDGPSLMNLRNDEAGPDEFSVLPTAPLEIPDGIASRPLPLPTPGGINRVDPDPEGDVAAALGGNVARANRNAADIVSYASRFGVSPQIRGTLAAEDLAFREANQGLLLERLFNVNVYYDAYRPLALNRYAELERMRRAGIRTPSAPPEFLE